MNTWDRVPFLTTVATGKPSLVPAVTNIHHNFIVSDGDADGGAIDNDDGSSFYNEHHNFAVFGICALPQHAHQYLSRHLRV